MSFLGNILEAVSGDSNFRRVIFTGSKTQLVVMEIPPQGEIGEEVHNNVEQILFFQRGAGKAIIGGEEKPIKPGDVFVVTPGTRHNFINTGSEALEVYTVYSPPNHIDGRIHKTKTDADLDTEDEAFGHKVQ